MPLTGHTASESWLDRARNVLHQNFLRVLIDYPFLLWICLVALLAELGAAILNLATLPMHLVFDLNAAWASGWAIAAFLFVEAAFKSPFGALSDRIGRKPLMVAGPIFSAIWCYAMFHATKPWQFIVLQGLNGAGYAAFWPACYAAIADRVPSRDRNTANSVFNMAYMLGVALGPLAKTVASSQDIRVGLARRLAHRRLDDLRRATEFQVRLHGRHPIRRALTHAVDVARVETQSWNKVLHMPIYKVEQMAHSYHLTSQHRLPFLMVSVLFLITALLALIVTPPMLATPVREEGDEEKVAAHHGEGGLLEQMAVGIRTIPWMMVIAFFTFMGIGTLSPILLPYVLKIYNVTERQFGLLLLPFAAAIGFCAIPLGRLSDRVGSGRSVRVGMSLCAVSMWLVVVQPFARDLPWPASILGSIGTLVPLMILVGLGFVVASPAWLTRVTEMAPPDIRGSVMGAAAMAQGGGALVGGIAGGYIWGAVQNTRFPEAPSLVCAIGVSIGALLTLWHVPASKPPVHEADSATQPGVAQADPDAENTGSTLES